MSTKAGPFLILVLMFGSSGVFSDLGAGMQQAASADEQRSAMLVKGKATFVEKCAKCHGEDGSKELSSGKPLSQRGLGNEAIIKAVNGRLSKGTDEERRAVTLYISSLMKDGGK